MRLISSFHLIILPFLLSSQSIVYVDHQATGGNDGTTWGNAYLELYDALENVSAGDSIFVSEGTYTPRDTGRNSSFVLIDQITVVGGFDPHNGITQYSQIISDFFNPVILSGDIGIVGDSSDNCYHVIRDIAQNALVQGSYLDGLNIKYGRADQDVPLNNDNGRGGGLWVRGAKLTLKDVDIAYNYAKYAGSAAMIEQGSEVSAIETGFYYNEVDILLGAGALNIFDSELIVFDCSFGRNSAFQGAGISASGSMVQITSSEFIDNEAAVGGAIYLDNDKKSFINQSRIYNNKGQTGAGIYNTSDSLLTIGNSIITVNHSTGNSGGIYNAAGGKIKIVNCNVNFNTAASSDGAGMRCVQGDCQVLNSMLYKNLIVTPSDTIVQNYGAFNVIRSEIGHSYVQGSGGSASWGVANTTDLGGNIDIDPVINWLTLGDTLSQELICQSSLINAGNNIYNMSNFDLDGKARIKLMTIDIGAQEYQNDSTNPFWTGQGDGVNWHNAQNWSGCQLPSVNDIVTINVPGQTVVVDTGLIALANTLRVIEGSTLQLNEDLLNSRHGELKTNSIVLDKNFDDPSIVSSLTALKSNSSTSDTAFIINRGNIKLANGLGIMCYGKYRIENMRVLEIETTQNGLQLHDQGIFVNQGILRILTNNQWSEFIIMNPFFKLRGEDYLTNQLKSNTSIIHFHNRPTGSIELLGGNSPQAHSSRIGLFIHSGHFVNDGVLSIEKMNTGLFLGDEGIVPPILLLRTFTNNGFTEIQQSINGASLVNGQMNNNGSFLIKAITGIPWKVETGEWTENGEFTIEN